MKSNEDFIKELKLLLADIPQLECHCFSSCAEWGCDCKCTCGAEEWSDHLSDFKQRWDLM